MLNIRNRRRPLVDEAGCPQVLRLKESPSLVYKRINTTGSINQSNIHKDFPHLTSPNKFPHPRPRKHSRMHPYPAKSTPFHQVPTLNLGTRTSVQEQQYTQPFRPFPPGSQQHQKLQNQRMSPTHAHRSTGRSRLRLCTRQCWSPRAWARGLPVHAWVTHPRRHADCSTARSATEARRTARSRQETRRAARRRAPGRSMPAESCPKERTRACLCLTWEMRPTTRWRLVARAFGSGGRCAKRTKS